MADSKTPEKSAKPASTAKPAASSKPAGSTAKPKAKTASTAIARGAKPTAELDPCVAAGMIGPQHAVLRVFEGKWRAAVSFWMQPGAEPSRSEGTMVNEWILGGRFLAQKYTSEFMGSPFAGQGLFGYNNVDRRYEGMWVDTMSTGMMTELGRYDAGLATFEMYGEVTEPESRKPMKKKTVITIDSPTQHTMSMHFSDPGGQNFWKCMEIVYTKI